MRRIAINQPNYVPWLGFFDLINRVDVFVILDTVQYTKQDWRNRNRIKTGGGPKWLTIPIKVPLGTLIKEVRCNDLSWIPTHLRQIENAYRDAPAYDEIMPLIRQWYRALGSLWLTDIDESLMRRVCDLLAIETDWVRASEFNAIDDQTNRLVDLCRVTGATHYVSGPAARAYLDTEAFARAGIEIEWMSYDYDFEYDQPHPPFLRGVSILDALLCCGPERSGNLLRGSYG